MNGIEVTIVHTYFIHTTHLLFLADAIHLHIQKKYLLSMRFQTQPLSRYAVFIKQDPA